VCGRNPKTRRRTSLAIHDAHQGGVSSGKRSKGDPNLNVEKFPDPPKKFPDSQLEEILSSSRCTPRNSQAGNATDMIISIREFNFHRQTLRTSNSQILISIKDRRSCSLFSLLLYESRFCLPTHPPYTFTAPYDTYMFTYMLLLLRRPERE
jgi:hypothetical protein